MTGQGIPDGRCKKEASSDLLPLRICYGINDRLPHDISILDVEKVQDGFHARHDAVARSYFYQISRRRTSFGSHFLWKQVRRMTGVVIEAGRGKLDPGDIPGFFRNRSDVPAGLTVPPSGLFLEKVYCRDEKINFTARPVISL